MATKEKTKTKPSKTKRSVASKLKNSKPTSKKPSTKSRTSKKRPAPGKSDRLDQLVFDKNRVRSRSGDQSGDLQGLSNVAGADSESVGELIEEGNAFEAGIVKGIEDAPNADEGDIITREVPEDDVPGEYLDDD